MLVVLGNLLSERTLTRVVAEFIDEERVVVANDAAAAVSIRRPSEHDVTRVRAALEEHGLAELDDEGDD